MKDLLLKINMLYIKKIKAKKFIIYGGL